jgi:GNAT superfamily N-acetyltransferase
MEVSAKPAHGRDILPWREMHRLEMGCQIVHDSIHDRAGFTDEYMLFAGGAAAGYGSIAVGGPWQGKPTAYQFYVAPHQRLHLFDLFDALLEASGAMNLLAQSNDALTTTMLLAFGRDVTSNAILFHDKASTQLQPPGATFRTPTASEDTEAPGEQLKWRGLVEVDGKVAGRGGILFHYNRPYGDIYMEIDEPFRRRGLGSFLVQELKRVCYEGGHVPAARCGTDNVASRRTLQKAGFVPCGHILHASVAAKSTK